MRNAVRAAMAVTLAVSAGYARADEVVLEPDRDNTMYSNDGTLSNGAGENVFAGQTRRAGSRRALLRFDVNSVPAGSQIVSAGLELTCTNSISQDTPFTLHRLTADWGEAGSDAGDPGGQGTPAEPGDATWTHRFYDTTLWTTEGGDFVAAPSASANIGFAGIYNINGLEPDVEYWQANPGQNFGWIIIGDELDPATAKRFGSRENLNPSVRPKLTIEFNPPAPCPGDLDGSGVVDLADLSTLLANYGTTSGATPEQGDINGDGAVDLTDLAALLANFGAACP